MSLFWMPMCLFSKHSSYLSICHPNSLYIYISLYISMFIFLTFYVPIYLSVVLTICTSISFDPASPWFPFPPLGLISLNLHYSLSLSPFHLTYLIIDISSLRISRLLCQGTRDTHELSERVLMVRCSESYFGAEFFCHEAGVAAM